MADVRIPFLCDTYMEGTPSGSAIVRPEDAWTVLAYYGIYCDYESNYNEPGITSPNAKLTLSVYLGGFADLTKFRFKYSITEDSDNGTVLASGYTDTIYCNTSGDPTFNVISPSTGQSIPYNYGFYDHYGYTVKSNISLPSAAYNSYYRVKIHAEYKLQNSSSWTDSPTYRDRVLRSHAPFNLTVTAPQTVYFNSRNDFSVSIPAYVESAITLEQRYWSQVSAGVWNTESIVFIPLNLPVRNANPPYITTGTATSYLYWCPQVPASAAGSASDGKYAWTLRLTMDDPGGGDFKIKVAEKTIQGTASWLGTDDNSMITVSDLAIEDLSGAYDTYGYVLRNIGAKIEMSVSVSPHYGASYTVVAYGSTLYSGNEDGDYSSTVDVPSTNDSFTINVQYRSNTKTVIVDSLTFAPSYINYSVPSFPNLAVHRCNEDGSSNDNGDHVRIEWAVAITPIANQNSKKLTISHSEGTTTYNPLSGYTQSGILIVTASTESSYSFSFTVQDDYNSIMRTLTVSTAGVIRDILFGGRGVSYGKVAEFQNALEVSPFWEFIAYKMKLNGTDMVAWVKEMLARMTAIEQFASNLGSTSQYQVTFYNNSQLIDRQWVQSGGDATAPEEEPVKEATNTQTFSFVGWALTNGATTANPNALKNITAYRSIYAAFSSATRYYSVFFKNAGTTLQTVSNLQYHGNASYTGSTPVDADNGTFIGWMPSGRYIEETKDANAQFYYDEEITDTWEEIINACNVGTYKDKYKPGNWKMLDLGTEGNIKMRVKGLRMHYAPGMKKLPMSWEADTALTTKKKMNSVRTPTEIIQEDALPGFTFNGVNGASVYRQIWHYYYATEEAASTTNKATATLVITATRTVTFTVDYRKSASSGTVYLTWAKDGVTKLDGGTLTTSYVSGESITLNSGQSTTITLETYTTNRASAARIRITEEATSEQAFAVDAGLTITFTTNTVDKVVGLTAGEGNIGGFASSELFNYLQNTIKPLFPEALRNGLKRARLNCASAKSTKDYPNYEFVPDSAVETDLFIPSSDEIVGANEGNTKGVDFDVRKYQYRKKGNTSSANGYWCRDTYNSQNRFSYITGYSSTDGNASRSYAYPDTAYAIYICFCT